VKNNSLKVESGKPEEQKSLSKRFVLYMLVFAVSYSLFTISTVLAADPSTVEGRITNFIKQFYNEREDVHVKFNNLPDALTEKVRVRHIDFAKVPDSNGDGLCLVEIDGKNSRARTVYVSFRVQSKKKLFVLKQSIKKGEILRSGDILVKDTFTTENSAVYPSRLEDVIGKTVKKDVAAGITVTNQILEDSFVVQRGEAVNIVAENKMLSVQAKGRTMEKGRMGDLIRVKNLTSDKEIVGRVAGSGTVKVDL
jgi:flagellar basal body P-ring formation protein FlgA